MFEDIVNTHDTFMKFLGIELSEEDKILPYLSGADLEIKRGGGGGGGFHLPETQSQLGVWGGAVSPKVGLGQSLGGAQGAKPPEDLRISSFFYPKNTLEIVF